MSDNLTDEQKAARSQLCDDYVQRFGTELALIIEDWNKKEFDFEAARTDAERAIRGELHEVWEWFRLEEQKDRAESQRDALRKAISECIDYANGREWEWGERAEHCFEFLAKSLRSL